MVDKVYRKHKKALNLFVKVNVKCEEIKYVVSKLMSILTSFLEIDT